MSGRLLLDAIGVSCQADGCICGRIVTQWVLTFRRHIRTSQYVQGTVCLCVLGAFSFVLPLWVWHIQICTRKNLPMWLTHWDLFLEQSAFVCLAHSGLYSRQSVSMCLASLIMQRKRALEFRECKEDWPWDGRQALCWLPWDWSRRWTWKSFTNWLHEDIGLQTSFAFCAFKNILTHTDEGLWCRQGSCRCCANQRWFKWNGFSSIQPHHLYFGKKSWLLHHRLPDSRAQCRCLDFAARI